MKSILLLFVVAIFGSGCAHTYNATSVSRTSPLKTNATALVALPEDGRFEKNVYSGSGRKAGLEVSAAFAKHLSRVDMASETGTLVQNLEFARNGKFDYLVIPQVIHWEDRATEWSGRQDKIEIEIRTVDSKTGETLTLGQVKGTSKWATFGGDVPEDLLAKPLGVYIAWLFSLEGTPLPLPRGSSNSQPVQSPKSQRR